MMKAYLLCLLVLFSATSAYSSLAAVACAAPSESSPHGNITPPPVSDRTPNTQGLYSQWQVQRLFTKSAFPDQRTNKEPAKAKMLLKPEPRKACASLRGKPFDPASFLARNFLRVSSGEWVPLSRSGSGKRLYLGAVRSVLHRRGDLQQLRLRAAQPFAAIRFPHRIQPSETGNQRNRVALSFSSVFTEKRN